jgi:hypothetical protein
MRSVPRRDPEAPKPPWWLLGNAPSPYPVKVQVVGSLLIVAVVGITVGVPYALGVPWLWNHSWLIGPVLGWLVYLPMRRWLRKRGYWDEARRRRFGHD